jgi:hypothetical protein
MIFIIVALVLKAHSAVQQVKMAKPDETLGPDFWWSENPAESLQETVALTG